MNGFQVTGVALGVLWAAMAALTVASFCRWRFLTPEKVVKLYNMNPGSPEVVAQLFRVERTHLESRLFGRITCLIFFSLVCVCVVAVWKIMIVGGML